MIKDILAVVEDGDVAADFLGSVGRLAAAHGAFLRVIALTPVPMDAPPLATFGAVYIPEFTMMGDGTGNVEKVRARLAATGCEHDVTGFQGEMAWLAGDVRRSRPIADLVVIGTEDSWSTPALRARVIQTLIRSAATPLLVLPTGRVFGAIRRAVLGWMPSPEAVRAVHALVQFADRGAIVDVVTVGPHLRDCEKERGTHAEVVRHLTRHGLVAEGRWVVNDEVIEAEALTLYANEQRADLLVVGGFAHSRIREIVLGGVTRELVWRANLPVLISG